MIRTKLLRPTLKQAEIPNKFSVILSDESVDRDGDIIRASGWELDDFLKRPIMLSSHDYHSVRSQIGEWEDVHVKGDQLLGTAVYYTGKGNEEADWAFQLAQMGRAAYSVGFMPKEWEEREDDGAGDSLFQPMEFTKQELLEVSQVTVPSNRNALQLMGRAKGLDPVVDEIVREMLVEGRAFDSASLGKFHSAIDILAGLHDVVCDRADCKLLRTATDTVTVSVSASPETVSASPVVVDDAANHSTGGSEVVFTPTDPERKEPDEPELLDDTAPKSLSDIVRESLHELIGETVR